MSSIREKVLEDLIDFELWRTYTIMDGKKVYTYEMEFPEYKEKLESEGSTWIVLKYDCMREYYQRNKERLDKEVSEILKKEAECLEK